MNKVFGKIINVIVLLAALAGIYLLVSGRTPFSNAQQEDYVIMPREEFAENPILLRERSGTLVVPEITKDNAKAIIESIELPENMVWEAQRTLYSSAGNQVRRARYRKTGSGFRVDLYTLSGSLQYSVSGNRSTVSVTDGDNSRTAPYSEQYKPEAVMGVLDLDYFLAASESNFLLAELRELDGESCLYVEYREPSIGQTERCYISLYYGVVLQAESYIGDRMTWSAETILIEGAD